MNLIILCKNKMILTIYREESKINIKSFLKNMTKIKYSAKKKKKLL